MTIDEMIERLEELRDELPAGGDTEVRLMNQPNWPFEYSIAGVISAVEGGGDEADEDSDMSVDSDEPQFVYIAEGTQLGYGSKNVWDNL